MRLLDFLFFGFFPRKTFGLPISILLMGSILVLSTGCDGPYYGKAPIVHGSFMGERTQEKEFPPSIVQVRRGDSLYSIAKHHQVDLRRLIDTNSIEVPYRIFPGQTLKLPTRSYNNFHKRKIRSRTRLNDKKTPKTRANLKKENNAKFRRTKAPPVDFKRPRQKSLKKQIAFIWPITGRIVSKFGNTGKGLHNDGINILARKGTPVRAVQGGIVAYAGNELRGFGNLILVKHAGGWISAYAHNERLLVNTGEKVEMGQVISRVGNTGSVKKPQLHFELRRGTKAVNPEMFLVKKIAAWTVYLRT